MTATPDIKTGGCLCGAVRYELTGPPLYQGFCCCEDCRKASGSGYIPFMGYAAANFKKTGDVVAVRHALRNGRVSTRSRCAKCGSLLFGGEYGVDQQHTVYAGTLDDPSFFSPREAIMTGGKPHWAALPEGLTHHEGMPE